MIVTRRRRRAFPWKRLGLPLLALLLLTFALWWPPSHNVIANGPLAPVWRAGDSVMQPVLAPFHFAAQNQTIGQQKSQIAQLQQQLNDEKTKEQAKDKQITSLQTQVNQAQTQAASANANAKPAHAAASPKLVDAAPTGADLTASATPDMKRTAQFWANMDPDAAAKLVQKLPVAYVARVFAAMSPDAVGPILDALPPAYAARLTQEHPELRR